MKQLTIHLWSLAIILLLYGCLPTQPDSGTKPQAPAIDSIAVGDAMITITWAPVSIASTYNLYYSAGTTVNKSGSKNKDISSPYILTGLTNGTKYAVSITAENSAGESELSNIRTIMPLPPIPNAPHISSAIAGVGMITVSWDTVSNATSYNIYCSYGYGSKNKVGVTSPYILNNLENGMEYAVSVSAVNVAGESKSSVDWKLTPTSVSGTVTDIDGNMYHYVSIGTQVWMLENLRTTRYNDGTSIPLVSDNIGWANLVTPGYCLPIDTSFAKYWGAYYNWYSINNDKLAPIGWHVPSDTEWTVLINYLGGASMAGGKLKSTRMTWAYDWDVPNTGATNFYGFAAFPGGARDSVGYFSGGKLFCEWWSTTQVDATHSRGLGIVYNSEAVNSFPANKRYGFSVRCIKN